MGYDIKISHSLHPASQLSLDRLYARKAKAFVKDHQLDASVVGPLITFQQQEGKHWDLWNDNISGNGGVGHFLNCLFPGIDNYGGEWCFDPAKPEDVATIEAALERARSGEFDPKGYHRTYHPEVFKDLLYLLRKGYRVKLESW